MLIIGVIKELQKSIDPSELLSYFFCQDTDSRLNNATAVLRGLMYQLLMQQQFLISHLREEYDQAGRQLFEDINAFDALSKIFAKMLGDVHLTKVYLIVDALDECDSGLSQLLDVIVRNASTSSSQVKWLVSSRNKPDIEERLRIKDSKIELSLELNAECVSGAVAEYIDYKVSEFERTKRYDSNLREQVKRDLHRKANGTFLWVALVCKELGTVGKWDALQWLTRVPSDLNLLYARIIDQIQRLEGRNPEFCFNVLSVVDISIISNVALEYIYKALRPPTRNLRLFLPQLCVPQQVMSPEPLQRAQNPRKTKTPALATNTEIYKSETQDRAGLKQIELPEYQNPLQFRRKDASKSPHEVLNFSMHSAAIGTSDQYQESREVPHSKNFGSPTKPNQSTSPKHLQDLSVGISVRLWLAYSSPKKHLSVPETSKSIRGEIPPSNDPITVCISSPRVTTSTLLSSRDGTSSWPDSPRSKATKPTRKNRRDIRRTVLDILSSSSAQENNELPSEIAHTHPRTHFQSLQSLQSLQSQPVNQRQGSQ